MHTMLLETPTARSPVTAPLPAPAALRARLPVPPRAAATVIVSIVLESPRRARRSMIRFGEIVANAAPTRRRHASPASADALAVPIALTTGEPARRRGPATARWVVAVDIMSGRAAHARRLGPGRSPDTGARPAECE